MCASISPLTHLKPFRDECVLKCIGNNVGLNKSTGMYGKPMWVKREETEKKEKNFNYCNALYCICKAEYMLPVPGQFVAGQFVADNSSQDNSSRTICRKIKY